MRFLRELYRTNTIHARLPIDNAHHPRTWPLNLDIKAPVLDHGSATFLSARQISRLSTARPVHRPILRTRSTMTSPHNHLPPSRTFDQDYSLPWSRPLHNRNSGTKHSTRNLPLLTYQKSDLFVLRLIDSARDSMPFEFNSSKRTSIADNSLLTQTGCIAPHVRNPGIPSSSDAGSTKSHRRDLSRHCVRQRYVSPWKIR